VRAEVSDFAEASSSQNTRRAPEEGCQIWAKAYRAGVNRLRIMRGMNASELAVGVAALAVIAGFVFWRFLLWIKNSPVHPDPWDATTEEAVQQPDAVEVCHHCLTQVPPGQWFCETCGCAVGPYNNYMPYVDCFSEGEVFRNGVTARMPRNLLILGGYFLITCSGLLIVPFLSGAPLFAAILGPLYLGALVVYWRLLFKNLFGRQPQSEVPQENPAG
jgi:hypothetical protein